MSHRVAFIRQRTYEPLSLRASIVRAIGCAGFDLAGASGKRVLLKPNLLGAYPPEMGVTTHPAFVTAVGQIFQEAGARVAVGDSSNGVHGIEKTWEATGMRATCRAAGFEEVHFEACGSTPRGVFMIARAPIEADVVVNLPKFKTHGLTTLSLSGLSCVALGIIVYRAQKGRAALVGRPHNLRMESPGHGQRHGLHGPKRLGHLRRPLAGLVGPGNRDVSRAEDVGDLQDVAAPGLLAQGLDLDPLQAEDALF